MFAADDDLIVLDDGTGLDWVLVWIDGPDKTQYLMRMQRWQAQGNEVYKPPFYDREVKPFKSYLR